MRKTRRGPLPLFSFILFIGATLATAYFIAGENVAVALLSSIGVVATIFAFFPKRVSLVEDFLDKNILPQTHILLIAVCSIYLLVMIFYVINNFKIDFNLTRKQKL